MKTETETPEGVGQPPIVRPCVSWRQSGGFWSIHEDGEGERLRISNSVRDIELAELNDDDLETLQHLIAVAIGFRKIHGPNTQHNFLLDVKSPLDIL